jgi:hypothetical protein
MRRTRTAEKVQYVAELPYGTTPHAPKKLYLLHEWFHRQQRDNNNHFSYQPIFGLRSGGVAY